MLDRSKPRRVVTIHDEREAARHARGRVSVIDDDDAVRDAVTAILAHEGYAAASYPCARSFVEFLELDEPLFPGPQCVLLDMKMPEMSGLELQQRLADLFRVMPVIFMSGGSSAGEAVQAMKNGAFDFLIKPFDGAQLLDAVANALAHSTLQQLHEVSAHEVRRRYATLSQRETQIARMVSEGMLNHEIASRLGIAQRTVKLHRMHMMHKLGAANVIDLVRLLDSL